MKNRRVPHSTQKAKFDTIPNPATNNDKRILILLEQAKNTNDFLKFDKYLKQLHKLRCDKADIPSEE